MDLITLLVALAVVSFVVWGGFWVCDRAGFPVPVKWVWGAVCLIVLLYFVLGQLGYAHALVFRRG